RLRAWLPGPIFWARAMPSPVARSGRGLTAICFSRGFPAAKRREIMRFFSEVGKVLEIPERQFDAFTVTYSSSHGYHALAALADAAAKLGLEKRTALLAAAHALGDGIAAWRGGKIPLPRLLREAATPGGTAATTIAAMNAAGYQGTIESGL